MIGSGQFIPGFEDALVGVKAGEKKVIEITFPEDYPAEKLAGKPATFDVTVKEVAEPGEIVLDDEFAKRLGLESIDKLRETIRKQIESEFGRATRQHVKRQLLDQLDSAHSFPLPENLVEQEFENIWRQVMHDVEHHGRSFEEEGTTEEAARRNTAASPSGGCGSGSSCPRSARRRRSRSPTKSCRARSSSRRGASAARSGR